MASPLGAWVCPEAPYVYPYHTSTCEKKTYPWEYVYLPAGQIRSIFVRKSPIYLYYITQTSVCPWPILTCRLPPSVKIDPFHNICHRDWDVMRRVRFNAMFVFLRRYPYNITSVVLLLCLHIGHDVAGSNPLTNCRQLLYCPSPPPRPEKETVFIFPY